MIVRCVLDGEVRKQLSLLINAVRSLVVVRAWMVRLAIIVRLLGRRKLRFVCTMIEVQYGSIALHCTSKHRLLHGTFTGFQVAKGRIHDVA